MACDIKQLDELEVGVVSRQLLAFPLFQGRNCVEVLHIHECVCVPLHQPECPNVLAARRRGTHAVYQFVPLDQITEGNYSQPLFRCILSRAHVLGGVTTQRSECFCSGTSNNIFIGSIYFGPHFFQKWDLDGCC